MDPHLESTDSENDIPLPPPPTYQPAQIGNSNVQTIDDASLRNEQLRQFYHDGDNEDNRREPQWAPHRGLSDQHREHENVDMRLYDDFSEDNSTLERYQSAENLQRLYPQLGNNENEGQQALTADEEFRHWAANSPVARNLQRVMSDGSFEQPQGTNTDHGAHWNRTHPASPFVQERTEQVGRNVSQAQTGLQMTRNQREPSRDMRDEQNRMHANAALPDMSREMLSKLDSILGVVQNLQNRVNQIENSGRQTAINEIPRRLQPRQVDPIHRQRLQSVLQDARPNRVQFNDSPSRPSAPP